MDSVEKLKRLLVAAGYCDRLNAQDARRVEHLEIFGRYFPALVRSIQDAIRANMAERERRAATALLLLSELSAAFPAGAEVLQRHFIGRETMERIADGMSYSLENIYRIQKKGLEMVTDAAAENFPKSF